jgi:hypothetical protein
MAVREHRAEGMITRFACAPRDVEGFAKKRFVLRPRITHA